MYAETSFERTGVGQGEINVLPQIVEMILTCMVMRIFVAFFIFVYTCMNKE